MICHCFKLEVVDLQAPGIEVLVFVLRTRSLGGRIAHDKNVVDEEAPSGMGA